MVVDLARVAIDCRIYGCQALRINVDTTTQWAGCADVVILSQGLGVHEKGYLLKLPCPVASSLFIKERQRAGRSLQAVYVVSCTDEWNPLPKRRCTPPYPADALFSCPNPVVRHNHDADDVVLRRLQCQVGLVHLSRRFCLSVPQVLLRHEAPWASWAWTQRKPRMR